MARGIAYGLVVVFLALALVVGVGNHLDYLQDPETFRRVYETPPLEQSITLAITVLAAAGLFFQARGWRGQRTSRIALAAVALEIAIGVAVPMSGVLVTCCG